MATYTFIEASSIYDPENIFFYLKGEAQEKTIDGVRFIEVTSDFKRVQFVRADSLKAIREVKKEF